MDRQDSTSPKTPPSDLKHRFAYHQPDMARGERHAQVRNECYELAEWLNDLLPAGREKALAITHLEEVMFWANAAIARQR